MPEETSQEAEWAARLRKEQLWKRVAEMALSPTNALGSLKMTIPVDMTVSSDKTTPKVEEPESVAPPHIQPVQTVPKDEKRQEKIERTIGNPDPDRYKQMTDEQTKNSQEQEKEEDRIPGSSALQRENQQKQDPTTRNVGPSPNNQKEKQQANDLGRERNIKRRTKPNRNNIHGRGVPGANAGATQTDAQSNTKERPKIPRGLFTNPCFWLFLIRDGIAFLLNALTFFTFPLGSSLMMPLTILIVPIYFVGLDYKIETIKSVFGKPPQLWAAFLMYNITFFFYVELVIQPKARLLHKGGAQKAGQAPKGRGLAPSAT